MDCGSKVFLKIINIFITIDYGHQKVNVLFLY